MNLLSILYTSLILCSTLVLGLEVFTWRRGESSGAQLFAGMLSGLGMLGYGGYIALAGPETHPWIAPAFLILSLVGMLQGRRLLKRAPAPPANGLR